MLLALPCVSEDDVKSAFEILLDEVSESLLPIIDYSEENYVIW